MNSIDNDVQKLVQKELNSANEKFPLFNSPHEGYAVIKEEIEECMDNTHEILEIFANAWYHIKKNEDSFTQIREVKEFAKKLAAEAIQVAAMCDKYDMSLADDTTHISHITVETKIHYEYPCGGGVLRGKS